MNYFEILNVKETATLEEIKGAYNILINNKEIKNNSSLLESLKKSYEVLSKDNFKKIYLQKLENLRKVKKDPSNTKIEYTIKNGSEKNDLVLSPEGIEFNRNKIKTSEIDFINTNVVKQKSGLLNSGDRYFINIGTKNKKITITIDNKLNIGNDIIFEDILGVALQYYRKSIVEKIKNKLTDKKHYNITEHLELTPKGVVITQNNINTVIPIENIEFITNYDTLIIKNNKKNLEYVFDSKDNLNNHMIVPFIYKDEIEELDELEEIDEINIKNESKNNLNKDAENFLAESLIIKESKKNVYITIGKNLSHIKELMKNPTDALHLELYNKYVFDEDKKHIDVLMFVRLYKQKLRSYMKKKDKLKKIQDLEKQEKIRQEQKSLKQNLIIILLAFLFGCLYLFLTNRI